jgi:hypothetical protein
MIARTTIQRERSVVLMIRRRHLSRVCVSLLKTVAQRLERNEVYVLSFTRVVVKILFFTFFFFFFEKD